MGPHSAPTRQVVFGYEPRADGSLSTTVGYDVRLRDSSGRPAEYRDLVDNSWAIGTKQRAITATPSSTTRRR